MNQTFTLLPERTLTSQSEEMAKAAMSNEAIYEPSEFSIQNILSYSKALKISKTKEGKRLFEMVLN